jgi:hypothetical protein
MTFVIGVPHFPCAPGRHEAAFDAVPLGWGAVGTRLPVALEALAVKRSADSNKLDDRRGRFATGHFRQQPNIV